MRRRENEDRVNRTLGMIQVKFFIWVENEKLAPAGPLITRVLNTRTSNHTLPVSQISDEEKKREKDFPSLIKNWKWKCLGNQNVTLHKL